MPLPFGPLAGQIPAQRLGGPWWRCQPLLLCELLAVVQKLGSGPKFAILLGGGGTGFVVGALISVSIIQNGSRLTILDGFRHVLHARLNQFHALLRQVL